MSDNKSIFDTFFSPENFQQPFLGNLEAFNKAWQDTVQKSQSEFTQPPLTVEDLDKRIQSLKSVENWLNLNLAMLKNTIQSLELQRTQLLSFQEMMQNSDALKTAGQQWWQSMQEQFQQFLHTQSQSLNTSTDSTSKAKPATHSTSKSTSTRKTTRKTSNKAR